MGSQQLGRYARWALPLLVALLGVVYGALYFHFFGEGWPQGIDYRTGFRAAIMDAQGYGYRYVINTGDYPGLDAFLDAKAESLPAPPPDLELTPPDSWCLRHLYMCKTMAIIWRHFGVNWGAIRVLHVFILVINLVLVFYIMRLALAPGLSVLLTAIFGLLPYGIVAMGDLRDYWKGPFFFAAFLIMGSLLLKPGKIGRYFGLAAALGGVIGVGYGFRADLLICLPPAFLCLAVTGATHAAWKHRAAAILLCGAAFFLLAWPMLSAEGDGGTNNHNVLMGQARECDVFLEVERASYERIYTIHDKYIQAMIDRYAKGHDPGAPPLTYNDSRSRRLAADIMRRLVLTFPADYFTRLWASVAASLRICGLPGVVATLIVMVYLCVYHPGRGFSLALIILYFCSYPVLQFQPRHVFHLAVFPLCSLGFLLQSTVGLLRKRIHFGRPASAWGAAALTAFLVATATIHAGASAIQRRQVESLAERLADAPTEPIRTTSEAEGPWVYARTPERRLPSRDETGFWDCRYSYLVAEFRSRPLPRTFWVLYATANMFVDFSKEFSITPAITDTDGPTRCYFPLYETVPTLPNDWASPVPGGAWSALKGLAFPADMAEDFLGLYTVCGVDDLALWPVLSVPPARTDLVAHERFRVPLRPLRLDNGLVSSFEESPDWPLIQAQMMIDTPDAVSILREEAAKRPDDWQAQLALATALRANSADAEAQAVYERALALEAGQ